MFRWIRSLRQTLQNNKSTTKSRTRKRSARLGIEGLEDRSLMSITLNPIPISMGEGKPFVGTVATFTDTTPGIYLATVDWGDNTLPTATMIVNHGGGLSDITGSHSYADEGSYTLSISLHDTSDGDMASASDTATVSDGALAGSNAQLSVQETKPFSGVVGTFQDDNPLTAIGDFTATIDWGDGNFSTGSIGSNAGGGYAVTGSHTYAVDGSYTVNVQVNDDGGGTAAIASPMTVTDLDGLKATAVNFGSVEGAGFSGSVATFTDTNSAGNVGDYSATITWGDGHSSAASSITLNGDGSYTVNGSHTYAEDGSSSFTVAVTKGSIGSNASGTATIGDALLTPANASVTATENTPITAVVGTFTDANASAPLGDFSATIDWGDGHSSNGSVAVGATGGFEVSGTHTYADNGHFDITVQITDKGGSTATANSSADVADLPPIVTANDISATEGLNFSGKVASFTDDTDGLPASDYVVTIDWGDGNSDNGTPIANSSGGYDVSGSHTYKVDGQYGFTVSVHSATNNNDGAGHANANVADAKLTATPVTVNATEQEAFTAVMAKFTDDNPFAHAADFTVTIDWGDHLTTAGSVTPDAAGGFDVNGTHTYAVYGTYNVVVTIDDTVNGQSGGSTATADSTAIVAGLAPTATGVDVHGTNMAPFTGEVATFTVPHPAAAGDFTATVTWGDGHTSAGSIVVDAAGGFDVNGTNTYAAMGQYAVHVNIKEVPTGKVATADSTATVVARILMGAGVDVKVDHGVVATSVLVATFHDLSGALPVVNYPTKIDWGDGAGLSNGFVTVAPDGTFSVKGTHTYAVPGKYTIKTAITNTGGMTINVSSNAVIGSKNERFVQAAYRDVLGRSVDPGGLAYWASQIDGGLNRSVFVLILTSTGEYRAHAVDAAFQQILGRPADPGAIAYFSGTGDAQLRVILYSSPEYYAAHGGTDDGWLTGVFNDALGRNLDAGARAYFTGLLRTVPRSVVASIIVNSPESFARIVNALYLKYVHRPADPGGIAFYSGLLQAGVRLEVVIADIVGSDEYYNLVTA